MEHQWSNQRFFCTLTSLGPRPGLVQREQTHPLVLVLPLVLGSLVTSDWITFGFAILTV